MDASPSSFESRSHVNEAFLGSLDHQHGQFAQRAIHNVLSSPIAEITYAQIIEGLPLSKVARDVYNWCLCDGHPLLGDHNDLGPGVIEKARQLRAQFDLNNIKLDSKLLHAYQAAAPGSRAFRTRLVELVAVVIHKAATWLFSLDLKLLEQHRPHLFAWRPSEEDLEQDYPEGYPPTLFYHAWYQDSDLYPEGIADHVGYWAESRIFGGVVLFDRREPVPAAQSGEHEPIDVSLSSAPDVVESDAIYLHPDRGDITYRIFKLTDEQRQQLIHFLMCETTPPPMCPLPILGSKENRQRVDPEEPIEITGIYRDPWERRPPGIEHQDRRLRDVFDVGFDYLTSEEWRSAWRRAAFQRDEIEAKAYALLDDENEDLE